MPTPAVDDEERRYLRDVRTTRCASRSRPTASAQLLQNILNVNLTLETKALSEAPTPDQNEEVKKISAWAAILFAPTLVGTIYGMNFDHMPELHWRFGYPFALGADGGGSARLYLSSNAATGFSARQAASTVGATLIIANGLRLTPAMTATEPCVPPSARWARIFAERTA